MYIETLNLDNHSSPYKIIISREYRDSCPLKSCMTSKYWYRYTVYFSGSKIFSCGYLKSLTNCKFKAHKWFKENV